MLETYLLYFYSAFHFCILKVRFIIIMRLKKFHAIKSQKGLRFLDEAIQGLMKELWRG